MTLSDACKEYEPAAELRLRPRTLSNRRSVHRQLCAGLGTLALEEITAERLDDYARARLKTVSTVTVNNELRALSALLTWARARGVATGPTPKQLPERPAFRVRSWTPSEVRRLLASLGKLSPALEMIVYLIAHTGLRCGEALALEWKNVDLERKLLRIWPSEEWSTKSGKPREVPIGDELLRKLRRLPRRSPWVFPSKAGKRYARWPQRAFDRARLAAGLTGGPHTLRHTYATEFIARGGSLPLLAQILGHSNERVTRLYAHLRAEHLAAARNVVSFGEEQGIFSTAGRIFKRLSSPIVELGLVGRAIEKLDRFLDL